MWGRGVRLTLLVAAICTTAIGAKEKEPPTPAERVAKLKQGCAKKRADLGGWAAGKKLGKVAGAQYRLAILMDPDCQRARSRLGYKKDRKSGGWVMGREKKWEYGKGAVEKHGEKLREKEAQLLAKELAAFEKLGLVLKKEGEEELARRLLLRVHLLQPSREKAAEGLGLVKIRHGYGTEAESKNVVVTPSVSDASSMGFLSQVVGMRTVVRRCGAVLCETVGDKRTAEEMARLGQQAQMLSCTRFGLEPRRGNWCTMIAAGNQGIFEQFVTNCGVFQGTDLAVCLKLGTAHAWAPRMFIATYGNAGLEGLFVHSVAEDALVSELYEKCPAWLHEAVAMDAALTLIGNPGSVCVAYEESLGLREKDPLKEPEDFGRRLLRGAGMGDLSRFELLLSTQISALGREDMVAAYAYYRFLLLSTEGGLADFAERLIGGEEQHKAIEAAFGKKPEEIGAEFLELIAGG